MARWSRPFKREHLGVTTRRNRAVMLAMVPPDRLAKYEEDFPESALPALPKKRGPRAKPNAIPGVDIDAVHGDAPILEKKVLADVLEALRNDPRVALVDRRQSGVFQEAERWIRVGTRGTLDISGMLVGGKYFEIECKRPGKKPDERQENRIQAIRRNGGVSGCATSAAEALALLP